MAAREREALISVLVADTIEWTADELFINSSSLEDFFSRSRVRPGQASSSFSPVMVNPETLDRLAKWAKQAGSSGSSSTLWLEGPAMEVDDFENPITMLAAKFADLAAGSGVLVLSYFCELSRREKLRPGNTSESQAMIALLYSLLRQMVETVLPRFESAADLSDGRFRSLDGTVATWEKAMSIFGDLVPLVPDSVLCVVDGFQWLGDRSTDTYLGEFVRALRREKLKILFTTTGRSACLRHEIPNPETVAVEPMQLRGLVERLELQPF